ncbi:hypothetical protein SynBIOSE41_03970 [Synechococcus sp. BIOS-E4-1]|nr:hypothetical protein SynBIOSE41_03970 [Synechococcus sp. BIOS-E4-1]
MKTTCTTDLPITPESSDRKDIAFPHVATLTMRLSKGIRAGIVTRALTEKRSESAVVRRWLRLGAAMEGVDISTW